MSALGETIPASWYASQKMFDVEMRSVYHKSWLYTCHTSRFQNIGDYLTFTIAGVEVVLLKDSQGQVQAYHNVCDLDSAVDQEPKAEDKNGTTFYWGTYTAKNLNSNNYNSNAALKMVQDAQYKINSHTTKQGLIYVNMNSDPDTTPDFDSWYSSLELESSVFDFTEYQYYKTYHLNGDFNWKTIVDGYQECYHCPTAHPGLSKAFSLPTYKIVPRNMWCRHFAESKTTGQEGLGEFDGLWMFMFPCTGVNCYSPAWYTFRVKPISATKTILQYDIYLKKNGDEAQQKDFVDFMQQLNVEDLFLCQDAQKNLNKEVYSTGPLHPNTENGVIFYQTEVTKMVLNHLNAEKQAGEEIWPAKVDPVESPEAGDLNEYFTAGSVAAY